MFMEQKIEQEWYEMWRHEMWRWYQGRWALGLLVNNELLQHSTDSLHCLETVYVQKLLIIEDA